MQFNVRFYIYKFALKPCTSELQYVKTNVESCPIASSQEGKYLVCQVELYAISGFEIALLVAWECIGHQGRKSKFLIMIYCHIWSMVSYDSHENWKRETVVFWFTLL
jgi:hypothetical protein